jgi:outer membrane protein assembly factor BamB
MIKKNIIKKISTHSIVFIGTVLLTACSAFFDKDNTPTPTPLTNYRAEVTPRLLWSARAGAGAEKNDYLKMTPVLNGTAIYTSSTKGVITSFDKRTGRINWQVKTQLPVIAGPGANDQLVVVASRQGQLLALQANSGRRVWASFVSGEVIAAPAVSNDLVIIKTIDGYVRALSTQDGSERWAYQQTEPNLILRGSSSPLIHHQSVLTGFANGNLAKLSLDNGQLAWTQPIALPEGAFAIQRMIDIDADPIVYGYHIYVATYQGKISSLDWNTGTILWSHDISSYTGMAADSNSVYVSDTTGFLWGFNADNGFVNWRQNKLEYRIISAPAVMGNYVVVGDAEGYLHWLSAVDGHFAGRVSVGSAIYAAPLVDNNVLYALTNNGYLAAYNSH